MAWFSKCFLYCDYRMLSVSVRFTDHELEADKLNLRSR